MNTLPSWLLLIVAARLLWEIVVRWPGGVTEVGAGERYAESPDCRELAPKLAPASVTSTRLLASNETGAPVGPQSSSLETRLTAGPTVSAGTSPYDWALDGYGDAA